MPGTPHSPASEELAWLRARVAELEAVNARLREAARARDELAAAQLAALAAQVEGLRRRLDKDSSTSSKPPSSDSPYTKKPKDRSLRGRSGRKPGKQPLRHEAQFHMPRQAGRDWRHISRSDGLPGAERPPREQ